MLLFAKGASICWIIPRLAVVGSRNATPGGMADAEAFAGALSHAGLTIVSGLALGIDSRASGRAALALVDDRGARYRTGQGLSCPPPRSRTPTAQRRTADFRVRSGNAAIASNFPRRNRIISGLARGCLIVEAALHSGSLITARQALEQGREVFAIPGSIHSPLSKGCHWLIKQGAKLVESAQDVLEELGFAQYRRRSTGEHATLHCSGRGGHACGVGFAPVDLDTICKRAWLDARCRFGHAVKAGTGRLHEPSPGRTLSENALTCSPQ